MPVLGSKNVPVDKVSFPAPVESILNLFSSLDKFTADPGEREDQGVPVQPQRERGGHRAVRLRQLAARVGGGVGKFLDILLVILLTIVLRLEYWLYCFH